MSSSSRIALENWLKILEVNGKVLDIGGGTQTLKGRVKVFKPDEYLIMDNNAEKNYHNKWTKADIKLDIQQENIYNQEINWPKYYSYFDQIFMIEVSEYLFNPIRALKNIYEMLNGGGKFYSSWHTLYGLHNPKGEDCLRYTKNAIKKLMNKSGFEIIEIIPRIITEEGRVWLERFYRVEGMRLDYSDPETWNEGYLVKAKKVT